MFFVAFLSLFLTSCQILLHFLLSPALLAFTIFLGRAFLGKAGGGESGYERNCNARFMLTTCVGCTDVLEHGCFGAGIVMLGTHGPAQALEGLDGERDEAWVDEVDEVKRRSDESMWIPPDRAYLKTRCSKGTVKDLE